MKKLLIIIALFIAAAFVIAASIQAAESSKSTKRLKLMEQYLKALDPYKNLKDARSVKAMNLAESRLTEAVAGGKTCLVEPDTTKREECKALLANNYVFAKQIYRLVKYYAMEEGQTVICIKADLGVDPILKAKGFNSGIAAKVASGQITNPKETGRTSPLQVFLCADSKGNKKLRVQDNSGTWLPLAPEEKTRADLQIGNLPGKTRVDQLEKDLGL